MSTLLFFGVIVLFFMHLSLRGQVKELTLTVRQLRERLGVGNMQHPVGHTQATPPPPPHIQSMEQEAQPAPNATMYAPAVTHPRALQSPVTPIATPNISPQPVHHIPPVQQIPQKPAEPSVITLWFKENTLIKVGAIIFFLGAVWFVSYAINQGWIAPLMRIVLGVLLGMSVALVGHIRRSHTEQYVTLTALGSSIVVASVFTGQFVFNISLLPPVAALIIQLIAIGYAVYVSLATKREWLCVSAAVAALVAPQLINAPENSTAFFMYLFAISVGFLGVLTKTTWRTITLTLALGVYLYELLAYSSGDVSHGNLWMYIMLFSALFYSATTVSIVRDRLPQPVDITTLSVSAMVFVVWASVLTDLDGLSVFSASLITASTGYILLVRGYAQRILALYMGLSGLLLLIATTMTFDGFTLTLALALEIGIALAVAAYIQFPRHFLFSIATSFTLPALLAFGAITSPDWEQGVLHGSAYSLYSVLIVCGALFIWLLTLSDRYQSRDLKKLAQLFAVLTYIFYMVIAGVFWKGLLFESALTNVMTYLSWLLASISILMIVPLRRASNAWFIFGICSTCFSLLASAASFMSDAWSSGVWHADAAGAYMVVGVLIGLTYWVNHLRNAFPENVLYMRTFGGVLLILWLFLVMLTWQFMHGMIPDTEIGLVLSYVTWALISYIYMYAMRILGVPIEWVVLSAGSFALPVIASLSSFGAPTWKLHWLHPSAAGLYVMNTLFLVLGITFSREAHTAGEGGRELKHISKMFMILSFLYAVALVWKISHAVVDASTAVILALFIYTTAGLGCYLGSKQTGRKDLKLVAALLLSGVVVRLAVIDVWNMEILSRIVTFLGIGLAFIVTALIEKPFQERSVENKPPQP